MEGCVGSKPEVFYNFWNCCPFEKFAPHCIPRSLPRHQDFVLLMTNTFGNGEARCIGRICNDTWNYSFPPQVWLDVVKKQDLLAFPRRDICSNFTNVPSQHEYDFLTWNYVLPLEADGLLLSFDSVVYFNESMLGKPPRRYRFWISSNKMAGTNITLRHMLI